jgi:hypothetical protein
MSPFQKSSTIEILTVTGRMTVDAAYIVRACPAIAVTRRAAGCAWALTHIPTGRTMSRHFPKLRDAKAAAAAVAELLAGVDLTTDDPAVAATRIMAVNGARAALFYR